MDMDGATVSYETAGGVARVTLNRPEKRNALSFEMTQALDAALDAAASAPETRAVLLAATGPAFCAGMDLTSVRLDDPVEARRFATLLAGIYRKLLTLEVPLLCAVDGPVTGGGVGLAVAGDLVWAGPRATFALPETRLGVVPALVSVVLRRRLGPLRLTGLALGAVSLDAERAVRQGLADFRAASTAVTEARRFAAALLRDHSPLAMRRTKAFLTAGGAAALDGELDRARREFEEAVATDDARRGLAAFRRKEPVRWNEE